MTGSEITVEGCGSDSLQGDVQFAKVMEAMGASLEWGPTSIKIRGEGLPPAKGLASLLHLLKSDKMPPFSESQVEKPDAQA